ncbi:MAG TPA: hypothetical protein VGN16_07995 [Acidobacteriaceae bacterium]|jgi:hypothetical protein
MKVQGMAMFVSVRSKALRLGLLVTMGLCAGSAIAAQDASDPPAGPGCTKYKTMYRCNWREFHRWLPHLHSVTVETDPMDRAAAGQLRELAAAMGKGVATPASPADLTFVLKPVEPTGIDFGPADRDLATLQIYSGNAVTGNRTLLWVETYRGQADKPWPLVVRALIDQFQQRLSAK